ncbi:hypothetical protein K443DRAFT_10522 [Laccaria amethystina LaAM-08-1]|uniref:Uncharacterized protein n=1 Tax=Laccaria amethystina LaAM-08-1 TaxID=1095629 RepID=A0A0C9X5L7_9AGAR|nr:hypothetical protein K443DRAFT_10522 [Laccaria amethystina LaAM-08-1]
MAMVKIFKVQLPLNLGGGPGSNRRTTHSSASNTVRLIDPIQRPGLRLRPDPEPNTARPDPIEMDEDGNVIRAWIQTRKYTGKEGKMKGTGKVALRGKVFSGFAKEARVNRIHHKTKWEGMDYDADIPFEKKAAPGFYDTSEEQAVIGGGSDASGRLLSDYEGLDVARMVQTPRTAPQRQRHDGGEKSAYKLNVYGLPDGTPRTFDPE